MFVLPIRGVGGRNSVAVKTTPLNCVPFYVSGNRLLANKNLLCRLPFVLFLCLSVTLLVETR